MTKELLFWCVAVFVAVAMLVGGFVLAGVNDNGFWLILSLFGIPTGGMIYECGIRG